MTAKNLSHALIECAMQGKASGATFQALMEASGGSRFAANRLLRTETNYVTGQGELEAFEEAGISRYRYVAVLDGRTSEICQELDGKEFDLKDAQVGVNMHPMHPWCRSGIEPVIDSVARDKQTRWARNPVTGEQMTVSGDMSYREWLDSIKDKHGAQDVEFSRKAMMGRRKDAMQFETYQGIVGKKELPRNLEGFQRLKYTEPETWRLLKGYTAGVRKGDLSALTGFETYKTFAKEVQSKLLGTTTVDGLTIQGYKTHFIDRLIGNYQQKREGVEIDAVKQVLQHSTDIVNTAKDRAPSRSYLHAGLQVTINPETMMLIQTNRARKAKR